MKDFSNGGINLWKEQLKSIFQIKNILLFKEFTNINILNI